MSEPGPESDATSISAITVPSGEDAAPAQRVTFREALRTWVYIGLNSFGGPAGQIAVMHRVLVEEKRWISETRFLHALNYCMLLPGPEAMQLATYVGWLLHRTRGGLAAGILFVLPGFATILGLSILYAGFHDVRIVEGLFFGLKPAVLAVVIEAVVRIGKRALKNRLMLAIAAFAFVAIFFFSVPFPLIVLGAALLGLIGGRLRPDKFQATGHAPSGPPSDERASAIGADVHEHTRPTLGRSLRVLFVWLVLWLSPIAALYATVGRQNVFTQEAVFFSKAAVVTFGGAYAVLAYIAQQAVDAYGWLQPGEMLDGLGMAETTPGPLIQVVQYVGFMGAYRDPGELHPMVAATLASVLVTWVTFVPCFLWIFLGAPFVEALRENRAISAALSGITAAVVGVILNLSVWFSLHTLFGEVGHAAAFGMRVHVPIWNTLSGVSLAIAGLSMLSLFRFKLGMIPTLAAAAALGAICRLLFA